MDLATSAAWGEKPVTDLQVHQAQATESEDDEDDKPAGSYTLLHQ